MDLPPCVIDDDSDEQTDLDESVVFDVCDLVAEDMDLGDMAPIRVHDVVPFVVLKFDPRVDKHWAVPEPQMFHNLVSRVECQAMEEGSDAQLAYRWANLWGKVGLLGLSSKKKPILCEYRRLVEAQVINGARFTLIPKDALEKRGNLTVLLRTPFKEFKYEWVPHAIMKRTRKLKGALRITHIKTFSSKDFTRNGSCKEGWRLLLLQGCPKFMTSLEQFGHDHRFPMGPGHVIIRGGSNRPRGHDQDRRGGQQQQRIQQQQEHGQPRERPGRSKSRVRSYSQDFPRNSSSNFTNLGGRGRGRGGPGSFAWGGPAPKGRGAST